MAPNPFELSNICLFLDPALRAIINSRRFPRIGVHPLPDHLNPFDMLITLLYNTADAAADDRNDRDPCEPRYRGE